LRKNFPSKTLCSCSESAALQKSFFSIKLFFNLDSAVFSKKNWEKLFFENTMFLFRICCSSKKFFSIKLFLIWTLSIFSIKTGKTFSVFFGLCQFFDKNWKNFFQFFQFSLDSVDFSIKTGKTFSVFSVFFGLCQFFDKNWKNFFQFFQFSLDSVDFSIKTGKTFSVFSGLCQFFD
jgi:hypothetical protein